MSSLIALLVVVVCLVLSPPMPAAPGQACVRSRHDGVSTCRRGRNLRRRLQGYGANASSGVRNGTYELPLYVKPSFNDQDTGWRSQYLPVGEVLRMFSVEPNGVANIYGHPEWNFPPTEPSYLTVYMSDDDLCQSKHDWLRTKLVLELVPSKERLREATARQRLRMGERYRAHKRDCSFGWR